MSDPNDGYNATLMQSTPQGEFWFVYRHGNGNSDYTGTYSIDTWQIAPFLQEVQAKPMTGGLSDPGKTCAP